MGPPGKLERDACRMAAALSWQISRDLVLKWAEVMVDAWIGAKRVRNTTTAHQPRHAKLAPGGGIMKTGASMPDCLNAVRQILAAARFAAERHAAQRRKGRTAEPYVNHLLEVAELLARTADDLDTNLIVAALLHDTIEDVGVTREEIAERFGEDVASLVAEVTDDKSLPKQTRKAMQIENAPAKSARAPAL